MKQQGKFLLFTLEEFERWLSGIVSTRIITTIQNHHTWSPGYGEFKGSNHFELLAGMENYHVNHNGWSEIAQNLTTFPDGTVAVGRPIEKVPAGIRGCNQQGICIEHLGNFDLVGDTMTDAHRRIIVGVNSALCKRFRLTPSTRSIVYHHWWDLVTGQRTDGTGSVKTCPGENFFGGNKVSDAEQHFIPLVKAAMEGQSGQLSMGKLK